MAKSVLVVDDSPLIHRLLEVRLKDENVELIHAMNGQAGLEAAKHVKPDLILLDVHMPGLGGFDVCTRLKDDPDTATIPVIFITGASDALDKVKGLDLGAVDYVTKPFEVAELRARVRAALRTVQFQKLLAQQAQLDGLTGLWNRAHFDRRLRETLAACCRHGRSTVLLMLDIDCFKSLNDTYGHPFGDQVLEFLADVLRTGVRTEDLPCRYGGEEFAIIAPDQGLPGGIPMAERLRNKLAEHVWHQRGDEFHVTVSIGLAASAGGADIETSARELLKAADEALYRAKRGGRNRVEGPVGWTALAEAATT